MHAYNFDLRILNYTSIENSQLTIAYQPRVKVTAVFSSHATADIRSHLESDRLVGAAIPHHVASICAAAEIINGRN